MGTNSIVILACTVRFIGFRKKGWVNVFRVVNLMVVVLHTVLEKCDSEIILKQTGSAQGSTMQIVNGMVIPILSSMTAVKETHVQSLLILQLLFELHPAKERKESHMSSFEMHWAAVNAIGHECKSKCSGAYYILRGTQGGLHHYIQGYTIIQSYHYIIIMFQCAMYY